LLVPDAWTQSFAPRTEVPSTGGRFQFPGVAPGRYRLMTHYQGFSEMLLDVGERDLDGMEIVAGIHQRCIVAVSAEEPGSLPLDNIGVALKSVRESGRYPLYGAILRPNLDENGRMEFDINPGYRVHLALAGLPDTTYIKAARAGAADVLEEGFEAVSSQPAGIEVLLSNKAGQTAGVVKDEDGEPVPAATVVLIPEFRRRNTFRFVRSTTTDEQGFYRIGSLEPGEYKVYAWTDVEAHRWNDPEFLRPYLSKGERVKVEPEAVKSVDLTALN
jgi:hypothetical protein